MCVGKVEIVHVLSKCIVSEVPHCHLQGCGYIMSSTCAVYSRVLIQVSR